MKKHTKTRKKRSEWIERLVGIAVDLAQKVIGETVRDRIWRILLAGLVAMVGQLIVTLLGH